ncbi:hypothetical protein GCM10008995_26900 [Halobellus salinus]|uniref:Uncharacterized protein n=1 Tax=Halobellus salinus TaxID=931585 RepID=A0A830EE56_9EURY|nr:hypothetical protein GCM10008995_26900 [Halobellus salinus]SMP33035.1 hypothetical protein SAMN06265347_12227 [Halobellus salinus]
MDTEGSLSPASVGDARAAFDAVGPTAKQVVREAAKAMEFDREEYRDRVTAPVVERARNVLFADRLAVTVGTRAEFNRWVDDSPNYEVTLFGSDDVDRVVWHAAPFADEVVAATFQSERDAAVGTLRRQAFSRIYRPRFAEDEAAGPPDAPGRDSADGSRNDSADGSRNDSADGSRNDSADGSRSDSADGSRSDSADGSRSDSADGGDPERDHR